MRSPNGELWRGRNQTSAWRGRGCPAASRTEEALRPAAWTAGSAEVMWDGRNSCALDVG